MYHLYFVENMYVSLWSYPLTEVTSPFTLLQDTVPSKMTFQVSVDMKRIKSNYSNVYAKACQLRYGMAMEKKREEGFPLQLKKKTNPISKMRMF